MKTQKNEAPDINCHIEKDGSITIVQDVNISKLPGTIKQSIKVE